MSLSVKRVREKKQPQGTYAPLDQECPATSSTKTFGVLLPNGENLMLNETGNAKAAVALRKANSRTEVTVNGTRHGHTIDVESINQP